MTDPNKRSDRSSGDEVIEIVLKARNYAEDSENKIHGADAARHGFRGGLVPGIGTYAYMTQALIRHLGPDWIARGWAEVQFRKPVYDGDDVRVAAFHAMEAQHPDRVAVHLSVNGAADDSVRAMAGMIAESSEIRIEDYPLHSVPSREARPPAMLDHWPVGALLGSRELTLDLDLAARTFVQDVLDSSPLYRGADAAAHPALLLAQANFILRDNIALGSWIHTASRIRHFSAARNGEHISMRGHIAEAFERTGHQYVTADLGVFAEASRPVAHFMHTAIIRLRG